MNTFTQQLLRDYYRATKSRRCPVCHRPDWCLIAKDGTKAICSRTLSKEKVGENAGYMHHLADPLPKYEPRNGVEKATPRIDFGPLSRQCEIAMSVENGVALCNSLGVSSDAIQNLETGWSQIHNAYTNPMRNQHDEIIGIRLRRPDGFKYAVTGSQNGLFIPRDCFDHEGTLYIVEGASDVAALFDMKLDAIGRPSCSSCVAMTQDFVYDSDHREWVIIEDHDDTKYRIDPVTKRPDLTKPYWPGQQGASTLAEALLETGKPGKVIAPIGAKDTREWKQNGATRQTVLGVAGNAPYFSKGTA